MSDGLEIHLRVPAYLASWLKVASVLLDENQNAIVRDALRSYLFPLLLLGSNVPQRLRPGAPVFSIGEDGSMKLEFVAKGDERVWTTNLLTVPEAISPDLKGLVVDVVKVGEGFVVSHAHVEWRSGVRLPFTPGESIAVGKLVPDTARTRGWFGPGAKPDAILEGWGGKETEAQRRRARDAARQRAYRAALRKDRAELRAIQNGLTAEKMAYKARSAEVSEAAAREARRPTPSPEGPPADGTGASEP